jgi:hypothetical protein
MSDILAGTCHARIEQLREHRFVGYLITIALSTGINLAGEIFLVDVTLRLSCTAESNNFKHQTIVNLTRCKFDGVEVNNHVAIFGSELHVVKSLNMANIGLDGAEIKG